MSLSTASEPWTSTSEKVAHPEKILHPEPMAVKVKFWGVRGSLPASASPAERIDEVRGLFQKFFDSGAKSRDDIAGFISSMSLPEVGGFGTATTCVEVSKGNTHIIIDGGSGIKNLGDELAKNRGLRGTFHIFMTHFHWDHLIGLPFFAPHFIPGAKIHYYSPQAELEFLIRGKFRRPYFPVAFEGLRSQIEFHHLHPRKSVKIGDLAITPYRLDHPDPCWGYRVEAEEKSYAHCVDTECTRFTREALGEDLALYEEADLMYFDAQYTVSELAEKSNWGHSASEIGLELAYRENIKQVLFCHHDPGASTAQILDLARRTAAHEDMILQSSPDTKKIAWSFAYDGLEVTL